MRCDRCEISGDLHLTIYGELLCEDCWDDYINSEQGRVEYLVSITKGAEDLRTFDADFLGVVARSWNKYKDYTVFSNTEKSEIETTAKRLNIL